MRTCAAVPIALIADPAHTKPLAQAGGIFLRSAFCPWR
jgi:hypothetical protein